MGGGSYSYYRASKRREDCYAKAESNKIFSKEMEQEMNPYNIVIEHGEERPVKMVRECCENTEHPVTFPIILGLDVTGSMGYIPESLIKNDFVELMKKIIEEGIECPQVCFVAYGDHECDKEPIQIGQFEASDEKMEKWLTSIWIEKGGGRNYGESTSLVHYFAARHTSCDAITKRGKKGLLITVGDEPTLNDYPSGKLSKIFYDNLKSSLTATEILKEAQKEWEIYHINILDKSGSRGYVQNAWKELLGDHLINVECNENSKVSNVIADLAVKSYKEQYGGHSQDNTPQSDAEAEIEHDEVKTHRRRL